MNGVQFKVEIGYNEFVFKNADEAKLFAVTAKKTSVDENIRVYIEIEWTDEQGRVLSNG